MTRINLHDHGQEILIPLGADRYREGEQVFYNERLWFGVGVLAAPARYGKTIVLKNLYAEIGQHRPIIILDYLGEHSLSRYPNFLSEDKTLCLPSLIEFKDFKFKISQFDKAADWRSLGFPEKSSQVMQDISRQRTAHRDDPELFKDMIADLPSTWSEVPRFEGKWGFEMGKLNAAVMESITTTFTQLYRQEFFGGVDDPNYDFGTLALRHWAININFQLDQSEVNKARAIAGKVLEQIERVIRRFSIPPCIIVEEGDILAPNVMPGEVVVMSSLERLVKFVLKLQKLGIEIWFVVQDPNNLNYNIMSNAHTKILGQLADSEYSKITRQLRWDYDANYREFAIIRKGQSGYQVFIPSDSCTAY